MVPDSASDANTLPDYNSLGRTSTVWDLLFLVLEKQSLQPIYVEEQLPAK